jgi:hypothetical protein
MQNMRFQFKSMLAICAGLSLSFSSVSLAQEESKLTEPVFRLSKNNGAVPVVAPHPLDPALELARTSLQRIQAEVHDYTATIVKRERIGDSLGEYEYMAAKVRNRKVVDGQVVTPFSVYLTFLKPSAIKGREVLYVENQRDGNLLAHEGGLKGRLLPSIPLSPTSSLAMSGQRYPLTDIGVENLVVKLIERGERDRSNGPCEVKFRQNAKIGERLCTVLEVRHNEKKPHYDFHVAQIFIDNELQMPIRYAAYDWPIEEGAQPQVIEEYTYLNLKANVGLTDKDFDAENEDYNF